MTLMRLLLTSLPWALVLVACTEVAQQDPTCADDKACADGRICALGLCVNPNDQRLRQVAVEIDPSVVGLPVQSVLDVDLRTSPRVDVTLAAGDLWSSDVRRRDADGNLVGLTAQVVARPERFIAGRVLAPAATTDDAGAFNVLVVEGQRYGLSVVPSDDSLPPLYVDDAIRAHGVAGRETLADFVCEAGAIVLTGSVKAGVDTATLGVTDLSVALTRDGRRVSSLASTSGEAGSFELRLPAAAAGTEHEPNRLDLEIRPAGNDGYPALSIHGINASQGGTIDLGVISLGDVLAPVPFTGRVVGSDGNAVPNATALFRADIGAGVYTKTAEADGDGNLNLLIPPGSYRIVVVGPADVSTAGLLVVDAVAVPSDGGTVDLNLRARVRYHGVVRDSDAVAVAGAAVSIVRIGGVDAAVPEDLGDTLVSFNVVSGADGAFDVGVDPGRYRVSVAPALGTNAPAFSELVTVPDGGLARDLAIPARAFVAGTVLFEGAPVPGAYVRVFSTFLDERGAAILLGEGVAAADGAFAIVVPDFTGVDVSNPSPPG